MARTPVARRPSRWSRRGIRALFALGAACLVAAGPRSPSAGKKGPAAAAVVPAPATQTGVVLTESFWRRPFRCEELLVQPDGGILVSCRENTAWKLLLARLDPEGRPELSFGRGGVAFVELMYGAVALAPDGRILAAGSRGVNQVAIARLTPGGLPDPGFGAGGAVQFGLGPRGLGAALHALAVQDDGKVVAAGYAFLSVRGGRYSPFSDFVVLRLLPTGEPDPSFGDRGTVSVTVGNRGSDTASALVIGTDGAMTVAGGTYAGLAPPASVAGQAVVHGTAGAGHKGPDFGLVRLLAGGAPDPAFGAAGTSVLVFGRVSSEPRFLALLPDGKLLAGGPVEYDRSDPRRPVPGYGVARFTANGLVDTTFGVGGSIETPLCTGDLYGKTIAVQPDGKIVLACPAADEPGDNRPVALRRQLLLMRYSADGTLDAGFADRGILRARVLSGPVDRTAVAVLPDGKVVVMCSGQDQPPAADGSPQGKSIAALVRLNADGSLDPTFGATPR